MSINKLNLGFNIWNNNTTKRSQSTMDYSLGKLRNTIGSRTRVLKNCSNSSDPLGCTLGTTINNINTPPPKPLPSPPINLSATYESQTAIISFIPGFDNGSPITDYLYSINRITYISSGQTTSPITITGLRNGIAYDITLKAVNDNGNSIASTSISVTPSTIPQPPTNLSAIMGNEEVTISFIHSLNGGAQVTDYLYSFDGFTFISSDYTSSPIKITGLTNGTVYNISLKAVNKNGNSNASSSVSATPSTVPNPPTILTANPGNSEAIITFIPGSNKGSSIIDYLYSIDNITYISTGDITSPITISGLTNGVTYNITLKAVNINGSSIASNSVSVTPTNVGPLAPVLTGISFKTTDTMIVTFTQEANGITITNYKYSIDGGNTYTPCSPVDIISPITISGLTANTTYNITLKAMSAVGESLTSNIITEKTYANVNYVSFTNPGTYSWTAPNGVTFIQYLIVGGGGGGGATYSKINVLGNVLVTGVPQAGAYWINSVNLTNDRYSGRMYYGTNTIYQNSSSFADPIQLTASQNFTPDRVIYAYNKWYATEIVYTLTSSLVNTTNYFPPYVIDSSYCNNISGGSGGGSGGQVKVLSGTNKYDVVPGNTYTIVVGNGGAGGVGGTNSESNGSPGEDSRFDTIVSQGGSGGSASRNTGQNQDTNKFGKGGQGGQGGGYLVGGSGGNSTINSNYGKYNSGSDGASGYYINFDGSGSVVYGAGGTGGIPNTVTTGTTVQSVGKGGAGTGAQLNSYANGIAGGSGIVVIKYYT